MTQTRINNKQTRKFIKNLSSDERTYVTDAIDEIVDALNRGTSKEAEEVRKIIGDSGKNLKENNHAAVSARTRDFVAHAEKTADAVKKYVSNLEADEERLAQIKALTEDEERLKAYVGQRERENETRREMMKAGAHGIVGAANAKERIQEVIEEKRPSSKKSSSIDEGMVRV